MSRPGLAVLALVAALGCGHAGPGATVAPAAAWPRPPDPPRIRLVSSLPAPLPAATSFWHRLWVVVTGLDETTPRARLARPQGVALLGGVVWVADPDAGVVWRIGEQPDDITPIACAGALALGTPVGVTATDFGAVFVADSGRGHVVAISAAGECLYEIAGPNLERPTGVAWDPARKALVVTDVARHQVVVLSADGELRRTIGARGASDGSFNFPTHVAVTSSGEILVVDALNFMVQRFDADTGAFTGKFGSAGDVAGYFNKPKGIAADGDGRIYVADALQDEVFLFDSGGRLLLAFGHGDDAPTSLAMPTGVAVGGDGRVYVADSLHHRVQVYQRVMEGTP